MESKPSISPSSFVDQQVFPGDVVLDLSKMSNQTIKLGGGLRQDGDVIFVMKAGKLRFSKPNKYWVESSHKRYVPSVGDNVLGIVVDARADNFFVDIKGPTLAFLPVLAFEGGTRRNIPKFEMGTLLYVRVVKANTGMNPELSCMDATGKAAEYGPLKDGFMFESSTGLSRTLLSSPTCPVLETLGKKIAFEIAVGLNGRVWVNATSPSTVILVANTIMQTEEIQLRKSGSEQSLLWLTLRRVPRTKSPKIQVIQSTPDQRQEAKVETVKESSPTSVFVNSEPIREDQVQNAVKFLSHPKVMGSPVMYRRSFLERKGLTKEEIDEAFRHVPDQNPAVTTAQPVVTNQGTTSIPKLVAQDSRVIIFAKKKVSSSVIERLTLSMSFYTIYKDGQAKSLSNVQQQPPTQVLQPTPVGPVGTISKMGTLYRFHWSHALLAVGFLAVSGAGTAVLFKNSIIPRLKSWIRKVVLEEEEEKSLLKKNDAKPSIAEEAAAAAKAAAAAAADVARASQEMLITKSEEKKCFEELINMLNVQVREMKSMSNAIQKLEGGQTVVGRISVDERDNQRFSTTSSRLPYTNGKADTDLRSVRSLSPPVPVEPALAPHPKSYMEIMEMIQRGEKPSNIREINDAPPNPNQPVSNPRLTPKLKPWEISQAQNTSNYELPDTQLNGDDWWQRKNVRITEIEAVDSQKFASPNVLNNERPIQRSSWVPPQPPPVVMPEAAAAIRQPKKPSSQIDQMTDDQLLARAPDTADELQRITKISESGGVLEANGEGSGVYSSEVAKEENGLYLEA
ncbi:hypothetical protein BUALT_Bualt07G0033700 [Buddleja alternifolia]|uniref:Peroxisomal membrane protein PEX14 n=1 Tax=Buddleja alternifolia TaxID=168488 RepID=A0AAV6XID7_9LAMI|nr:hypothetical protein BUALT_Bualt07G0033700 [Buddleja alternifolia]